MLGLPVKIVQARKVVPGNYRTILPGHNWTQLHIDSKVKQLVLLSLNILVFKMERGLNHCIKVIDPKFDKPDTTSFKRSKPRTRSSIFSACCDVNRISSFRK